jgi:osmotically-inducible protein OsmY
MASSASQDRADDRANAIVDSLPGENFRDASTREVEMPLQGEDMRALVLNAFYWDLAVPRHRLNVDVADGWVTVSGMVDLPYQRSCAESDAKSVPGVVGVTNLIRLADRTELGQSPH